MSSQWNNIQNEWKDYHNISGEKFSPPHNTYSFMIVIQCLLVIGLASRIYNYFKITSCRQSERC